MHRMSMESEAQLDAARDTDALTKKFASGQVSVPGKSNQQEEKQEEEEEDEEDEGDEQANGTTTGCSPFFGVKHYLHSFYGLPNEQHVKLLREEGFETEDYNPPERSCCFRFTLAVLVICTLAGVAFLAFGFLWPPKRVTVESFRQSSLEDNWALLDQSAIEFNKRLDWFKLIGLGLICLAGLLALCLLIVPICRAPDGGNYKRNKWIGWKLINQSTEKSQVAVTSEAPIPVKETIKAIQPQ